jgi:hypothetical protein
MPLGQLLKLKNSCQMDGSLDRALGGTNLFDWQLQHKSQEGNTKMTLTWSTK